MIISIVYLEHGMVITKKEYQSWREIQDEFGDYKTSLGPWDTKEVTDYLSDEYPDLSPSAEVQVMKLIENGNESLKLTFNDSASIQE
ncbi:MAG: hypothetical protein P8178_08145 [Candidatus Thiodiazotropha sp.]